MWVDISGNVRYNLIITRKYMQLEPVDDVWTTIAPTEPGYYWHVLDGNTPRIYFIGYYKDGSHNTLPILKNQKLQVCSSCTKLTKNCVSPDMYGGKWIKAF